MRGVGVSGVSIEMTPDPRLDGENWPPSGHYCIPPWKQAKRDLCEKIRTVFGKDHHCDNVGAITMERVEFNGFLNYFIFRVTREK